MKKQIVFIHGGETFKNYDEYLKFLKDYVYEVKDINQRSWWRDNLADDLGSDFWLVKPKMPNDFNAKYLEWKIFFENFIPSLADEVVLVGHSLGAIFLAKYLAENTFPKKIIATFLLAAPFDDSESEYSLADFVLPASLKKIKEQGGKIFLYHSKDDPVVPFNDFEKYKKLLTGAETRVFENLNHFRQEHFPELVADIKNLFK